MCSAATELTIGDLAFADFAHQLRSGICLQIGPFVVKITATADIVTRPLFDLYRDYPLRPEPGLVSFHVRLDERRSVPLVGNKNIRFTVDGQSPHEDMPLDQALPVLEWGINLVIALRTHCYLMLHSAVVEIDGAAVLLPAAPGAGKTTLCAGLCMRGWRLFSDEFGLIRPGTHDMIPVPRPMALKNESIPLLREFAPQATIGPEIPNTRKGTVAHLKPPSESISRSDECAPVKWIIFPRWSADVPTTLVGISKSEAFMFLASNAFNYEVLGEPAFQTVVDIVEQSHCYHLDYSDLDNAVLALTDFIRRNAN